MSSFLKVASPMVSVLLALYGLFELGERLYREANFSVATLALTIVVLLALPLGYRVYRSAQLWYFGIREGTSKRICLEFQRETRIDADRNVAIKKSQRFVFLEAPGQDELWDIYSVSSEHSLDKFAYESMDSTEAKRQQRRHNRLAIFWKPRTPIVVNGEYLHEAAWSLHFKYDKPAFFSEFHCVAPTGKFIEIIESEHKIERALAFRKSRLTLGSSLSGAKLVQRAFQGLQDRMAQPRVVEGGCKVIWEIDNPDLGRDYVCVLFFEGGEDFWRKELQKTRASLLDRLLRKPQKWVCS